jgi:hypothetical protein
LATTLNAKPFKLKGGLPLERTYSGPGVKNDQESGFWILDSGYWILDIGYWILDTGYWIWFPKPTTAFQKNTFILRLSSLVPRFTSGMS